jgi:hypothetical protein
LILGYASVQQAQRYLNVTDEELPGYIALANMAARVSSSQAL